MTRESHKTAICSAISNPLALDICKIYNWKKDPTSTRCKQWQIKQIIQNFFLELWQSRFISTRLENNINIHNIIFPWCALPSRDSYDFILSSQDEDGLECHQKLAYMLNMKIIQDCTYRSVASIVRCWFSLSFYWTKKKKNISYFFHPYRTTLLSFCTATDGTGGGFRSNFFLLLEEDTSQSQGPTLQDLILLLINLRFLEWQSGRTSPTYTHLRPNLLHPIKSLYTA